MGTKKAAAGRDAETVQYEQNYLLPQTEEIQVGSEIKKQFRKVYFLKLLITKRLYIKKRQLASTFCRFPSFSNINSKFFVVFSSI